MLMAQDNSSGHHLNAHVGSDIWWAAGENNTRQDTGILISVSWLAVLQSQWRGNCGCGLDAVVSLPLPPAVREVTWHLCGKASDSNMSNRGSTWLLCLSRVERLNGFLGHLDTWQLTATLTVTKTRIFTLTINHNHFLSLCIAGTTVN